MDEYPNIQDADSYPRDDVPQEAPVFPDENDTNSDSRFAPRSPVKQYQSIHGSPFDLGLITTPSLAHQLAATTSRSTEIGKCQPNLMHSWLHGHKDDSSLRTFNHTQKANAHSRLKTDAPTTSNQAVLSRDDGDDNDSEILPIATNLHSDSQSVVEGVEKLTVKYNPHREISSAPESTVQQGPSPTSVSYPQPNARTPKRQTIFWKAYVVKELVRRYTAHWVKAQRRQCVEKSSKRRTSGRTLSGHVKRSTARPRHLSRTPSVSSLDKDGPTSLSARWEADVLKSMELHISPRQPSASDSKQLATPQMKTFAPAQDVDAISSNPSTQPFSFTSLSHSSAPSKRQMNPSNTLSHSRKHPDDSSDEEDSGNPSKKPKPSSDSDHVRLLACPYFKLDPARYSEANTLEKNYRGCSSVYLRDIARVKQHLYRVHQQPRNLCPRCSALFPNAQELDVHFRKRVACSASASAFPERFSERQYRELKRRWPRENVTESWMRIWRILFPDVQCPSSPYLEAVTEPATDVQEVTDVSDFIADFRVRAPSMLQEILQEALRPQLSAGLATWLRSREAALVLEESVGRLIRRIAPSLSHSTTVPPAPLPELPLLGFTWIDSAAGDFYSLPSSDIWNERNFLQSLDDLPSTEIWDDFGIDTSLESFSDQQLNNRILEHIPADSADILNTQISTREPWKNLLEDTGSENTHVAGEDMISTAQTYRR
jgi:hypothetical protein